MMLTAPTGIRTRQPLSGQLQRGAVIVPAYNEEEVIRRTLSPLSQAAVAGYIELIVVCNGCTDDTADAARTVPGARVLELSQGSKPAALNAGDATAVLWPRLYLDADIQITAAAVLDVLDRLTRGDVMAARPEARYDFLGASAVVRSYYRARQRIPAHKLAMWGAGVYGLSAEGHERLGTFPIITGDDFYVDTRFSPEEKAVVTTEPVVVRTPTNIRSLLAILRRSHRGKAELSPYGGGAGAGARNTTAPSAIAAMGAVRGPGSAADAAVYIGMALAKRWTPGPTPEWERDESSRLADESAAETE
jgi:glycosyltransferase involved in cell wall biosynthesis